MTTYFCHIKWQRKILVSYFLEKLEQGQKSICVVTSRRNLTNKIWKTFIGIKFFEIISDWKAWKYNILTMVPLLYNGTTFHYRFSQRMNSLVHVFSWYTKTFPPHIDYLTFFPPFYLYCIPLKLISYPRQ